MTSNKEAAYYSAVERAFRGKPSEAMKYDGVVYDPDDPQFQHGSAKVLAALNALSDSETVDKNTFAFMLGIGPSALGKCDLPSPAKDKRKIVVDKGGITTRTVKGPVLWTVKQVKDFSANRKKKDEGTRDNRSTKAVERRKEKEKKTVARKQVFADLVEKVTQLSNSDVVDIRDLLKVVTDVIVALDNRILGFVDLHSLTRDELTSAFRGGSRIERMTLREALIVRAWVSSAERMPWLAGYRGLFDQATHREKELIAKREGERLGEVIDGAVDPSADVRATDRNKRDTRL